LVPPRTIIACLLSVNACGPDTAAKPAGSDESGGGGSTSGTTIIGPSPSEDSTAPEADSSSTGTTPDPCGASSPPDCPEGCTESVVYRVDDLATCLASSTYACVSGEHADDPASGRSFWQGDRFVLVGTYCGDDVAPDSTWNECLADDPAAPSGCDCFCREGVCPGEEDYAAFLACEFDAPCPVSEVAAIGIDSGDPACVLTALRDRTPGVQETRYAGFLYEHSLVHLDGGETALVVEERDTENVSCPGRASLWTDAQRCTLASPAVFDACLAETDDELIGNCLVPSATWFTSCSPAEPSCI
jgi:hypothetical protein